MGNPLSKKSGTPLTLIAKGLLTVGSKAVIILTYKHTLERTMNSKLINAASGITAAVGFFLVFGVSGALDTATDAELVPLCLIAAAGLGLFFAGINRLTHSD